MTTARCIGTVDTDGVALAAIQALYEIVMEKDSRIQTLQEEMSELRKRLDAVESE